MNKKTLLLLATVGILLVSILSWRTAQAPDATNGEELVGGETPSHEEAELLGFGFIQDIILVAPPSSDPEAATRIYEALSSSARDSVEESFISSDIAHFVGIQDVPDLGVSVEDLQVIDDTHVTLILGLNYTGTKALRALNMVVEGSEWKIDSVDLLDVYPPEPPVQIPVVPSVPTNPTTPTEPSTPVVQGGCQVAGCSSQLCVDSSMGDIMTTCEWREEYACYQTASCERQSDGQCGWTPTNELQSCLQNSNSNQ